MVRRAKIPDEENAWRNGEACSRCEAEDDESCFLHLKLFLIALCLT
jgi:hypothetical protein